MAERWLPVVGFEDRYMVSDMGRVKRLPCYSKSGAYLPEKIVRLQKIDKYGHRQVHLLREDGTQKRMFIHRLVMASFVGPCPEGMVVCHNDGNPRNNRLDNLRYDTKHGNEVDTSRMGRRFGQKFTTEQVKEIRKLQGVKSAIEIAKEYGVERGAIYDIWKGRTYNWLEDE